MFTGLVADLGTVAEVHSTNDGVRLAIESPLARELSEGDSVAVNGVCLTAVGLCGDRFGADVMNETLRRSSLAEVRSGTKVNLELALAANARLGGHFVQGHVDGVGAVSAVREDGFARVVTVQAEPAAAALRGREGLDHRRRRLAHRGAHRRRPPSTSRSSPRRSSAPTSGPPRRARLSTLRSTSWPSTWRSC